MALIFIVPICLAEDSVLPARSSAKAIVCIYRTYRFIGSSAHDELYINGTHLAKLDEKQEAKPETRDADKPPAS